MKHHAAMIGLAAGLVLMVGAPAGAVNSVTIESKTLPANASGAIGIAITNDVDLSAVIIPLIIRELSPITPCCYITALAAQRTPGGRLVGVLNGLPSSIQTYPAPDGQCKNGFAGGFRTPGLPDFVSPDGVIFSLIEGMPPDPLPPGSDPPGGSLQLQVTVSNRGAQFEIDTTCVDPAQHLEFVPVGGPGFVPQFTKGVITSRECSSTGDVNNDGIGLSVADYVALIRFVNFGGPTPQTPPPGFEWFQGDLNGDGYIDQADIDVFTCYFTYGMSCFPQFPVPVSCCPDTVRGCCMTSAGNYVRSPANCALLGGTYMGDGKSCCVEPPGGMVAWWTFDREDMLTFADIAGAVNNVGGYVGSTPTVVPGCVDGALSLSGNDFVSVSDQAELDFGLGSLSIDAWIRTTASGIVPIVDKRSGTGDPGDPLLGYTLFLYNGRLGFHMADGVGSGCICGGAGQCTNYIASGPNIADGLCHHVAVTVDRTTGTTGILYADGVPVLTFTPRTGNLDNPGDLWIGRRFPIPCASSEKYWVGEIDEVEMFNRALSGAEIAALCNSAGKCKCDCSKHQTGDMNDDGVPDVFDVIYLIDYVFSGGAAPPKDPLCPHINRSDVNCDGVADIFDVIGLIDFVFGGGKAPCDPCLCVPLYPDDCPPW